MCKIVVPVTVAIGALVGLEDFVAHLFLALAAQQRMVVFAGVAKFKIKLAVFTAEIFVRADTGQTSDTRVRIGGDPSSGTVHVAVTIGREWGNKQTKEVHGRVSGEHFQWQQKRERQRHNTINSPVR